MVYDTAHATESLWYMIQHTVLDHSKYLFSNGPVYVFLSGGSIVKPWCGNENQEIKLLWPRHYMMLTELLCPKHYMMLIELL